MTANMNTPFSKNLHTAVTKLNNMGVAMLEQGYPEEAKKALSESLLFLQNIASSEEQQMPATAAYTVAEAIALRNASYNLCRILIGDEEENKKTFTANVRVISLEQDSSALSQELFQKSSQDSFTTSTFLIRFETVDENSHTSTNFVLGLESAILLYNLGIAQLMLSKALPGEKALQRTTTALKILQLALSTVEQFASTGLHMKRVELLNNADSESSTRRDDDSLPAGTTPALLGAHGALQTHL